MFNGARLLREMSRPMLSACFSIINGSHTRIVGIAFSYVFANPTLCELNGYSRAEYNINCLTWLALNGKTKVFLLFPMDR